jgi:purine-binding chemotaxis protein CheW
MHTASQSQQPCALEFLSFRLGHEEYGIDIQKVQELRGVIVPIIDLRIKLGFASPSYDQFTVVIILFVGVGVDSVSDVLTLTPGQIKPVPPVQAGAEARHVMGMGALDERMIILVDIALLLAGAEGAPSGQLAA